jgi:hypothetical protein
MARTDLKISGFMCCFCNESIEENKIDPCDINVVINSEICKPSCERTSQNFYAHFKCLQEKFHKNIQGSFVLDYSMDE